MAQQKIREEKIALKLEQLDDYLQLNKLVPAETLVNELISSGHGPQIKPHILYELYDRLAKSYEDDNYSIRRGLRHATEEEVIENYKKIIFYYEKARSYIGILTIENRNKFVSGLIAAYGYMGNSLRDRNEHLQARNYYKEAIRLGATTYCKVQGDCCFFVASSYFLHQKYELAIELCDEGCLYADNPVKQFEAYFDRLFFQHTKEEGKLSIIEWCYEQAEKNYTSKNYVIGIEWCLKVLAYVSYCTQPVTGYFLRTHECLYRCYEQQYSRAFSHDAYINMAKQSVTLSILYLDSGRDEEARRHYDSACAFAQQLGDDTIGFNELREKFHREFKSFEPRELFVKKTRKRRLYEDLGQTDRELPDDRKKMSSYMRSDYADAYQDMPFEPNEGYGPSTWPELQPELKFNNQSVPFVPSSEQSGPYENYDQATWPELEPELESNSQPPPSIPPPKQSGTGALPSTLKFSHFRKTERTDIDFDEKIKPNELKYATNVSFFKFEPAERKASVKNREKKSSENFSDEAVAEGSLDSDSDLDSEEKKDLTIRKQKRLTQEAKDKMGRWGEHCVYEKLQQHYQANYKETSISPTKLGFILQGKSKKDNSKVQFEVVWHNRNAKIGEDYPGPDFTIKKTKFGRDGRYEYMKVRYIEVKTTTSNTPHKADFTKEQLKYMMRYKEKYSIYRVFNAGKPQVRIQKIRNPAEKILQKELNVKSIRFRV